MTHASVPQEQRELLGIDDNFVRMSVGIEDYEDLLHDMNSALEKAVYFFFSLLLLFHFRCLHFCFCF
jgi:hypothetical protein